MKNNLVDRLAYAGDAGFYELIPQAVVQPNSIHEIIQLFQWSDATGTPLCFRAGGTSLSGQSITDGILVDIGKHWRSIEPLDNGKLVKVQPGIIASMVNHFLLRYGTKIGPDPSSIHAAMMGGILSNNSSGMCCGVAYNAYHTLQSIHFVLPNGHIYNTAQEEDYNRFINDENEICTTLLQFRKQILDSTILLQKIRTKYQTKNTVGYGLNALVDYEHPLDIFSHLLIGAEGTLAFIAEAVLQTIPIQPHTSTALLFFNTISDACNAILPLKESGADVLELMDRASLRSVEDLKGLPSYFKDLPESAACLLCEYAAPSEIDLEQILKRASPTISKLQLLYPSEFTSSAEQRQFYWKIRKGMFPSVGAVRARGTTVILEDIALRLFCGLSCLVDCSWLISGLLKNFAHVEF
ncbi:MAG: FAD-binding oxidoreductase [Sediminibacterium sp.]|nr:FAD-binding oxidoreductase [Sediminibacterium sp.]